MSRTRTLVAATAVTALVLAGACSGDDDEDVASEAPAATTEPSATADTGPSDTVPAEGIAFEDPWIRESPMVTGAAAGYVTITSAVDDELVAVQVDPSVAGRVELHETVMADAPAMEQDREMDQDQDMDQEGDMPAGAMEMRQVESIELPAGEPVSLEPGGLHLMILELAAQLEEGQEVEMTLVFAQAGEQVVTFEVRSS